jgi:hypothetical protein
MRTFHLGTILSVTTGRLLAPNGFGDVHGLLEHMAGEALWTHQLPRVSRECEAPLLAQFPQFAEIEVPDFPDPAHYGDWVDDLAQRLGAWFEVAPLTGGEHTSIGPITEFGQVAPGKPVVVAALEATEV